MRAAMVPSERHGRLLQVVRVGAWDERRGAKRAIMAKNERSGGGGASSNGKGGRHDAFTDRSTAFVPRHGAYLTLCVPSSHPYARCGLHDHADPHALVTGERESNERVENW